MLAHLLPAPAALHATLLAATTTTVARKTSGSSTIVLFLVVILGVGYFAFMRPRQKQRLAAQQASQQRPLEVGDEVATSAGIIGRVRRVDDDRVQLEIAPGMTIQVLRQNLGRPLASAGADLPLGPIGPGPAEPSWSEDDVEPEDDGAAPVASSASANGAGASRRSSRGGSRGASRRGGPGDASDLDDGGDRAPGWSLTSDDVHSGEGDAAPAGGSAG